jgi:hypothetical protein
MNNKLRELYKYSNPEEVNRRAMLLHLNEIHPSSRSKSKYMVFDPYEQKMKFFGQMGYEDYTKHNNEKRRDNFRKRNHKWANAPIYSPRFLSWYLTW